MSLKMYCPGCGSALENNQDEFIKCCKCGESWELYEVDIVDADSITPVKPDGCNACGGPFPACDSTCKLFK